MSVTLFATEDLFQLSPEHAGQNPARSRSTAGSQIEKLKQEFQNDAAFGQRHLTTSIQKSRRDLVPEDEQANLPPKALAILYRYGIVDTLAQHYARKTHQTFVALLVIAFSAMAVFECFAHLVPELSPMGSWQRKQLWLYPALWLGAWALWYHAHRRQYQKKHHDYRALAEGLRVQLFWKLLGLQDKVEEYYLRKQRGELEWIRDALSYWRERDEACIADPAPSEQVARSRKEQVARLWVSSQLKYFGMVAAPREKQRSKACKLWAGLLFWTSLALALVWLGFAIWGRHPPDPSLGLAHEESILIFAISILIAAAALIIAYGEKMAFAEHARQYSATALLFLSAFPQMTTSDGLESMRDLGREALQENGDWLLLHRDRPLEVIVP